MDKKFCMQKEKSLYDTDIAIYIVGVPEKFKSFLASSNVFAPWNVSWNS